MKRRILLFCLATLLCVAAVVVWKYRATIFRNGDVSELYLRYADTEGINATFIKDFHVNDTVYVDVTLLQATDSAGWETLLSNVKLPEEMHELIELWKQKKHVMLHIFPKYQINDPTDSIFINNNIIAIDWAEQELAIFHITERKQLEAIISYHLDIVKNNKKQEL